MQALWAACLAAITFCARGRCEDALPAKIASGTKEAGRKRQWWRITMTFMLSALVCISFGALSAIIGCAVLYGGKK